MRREVESGATGDLSRAEEEMGDLLFAIANLSRKLGIEPESALRRANEKFTLRFDAVEQALRRAGTVIDGSHAGGDGSGVAEGEELSVLATTRTKTTKNTKIAKFSSSISGGSCVIRPSSCCSSSPA